MEIDKFTELLAEVWRDIPPSTDRKVVLYQGCLVQGGVERSSKNLNLCSDPNCNSCRSWNKLIKEEADKL
jgi:hypothetical protein